MTKGQILKQFFCLFIHVLFLIFGTDTFKHYFKKADYLKINLQCFSLSYSSLIPEYPLVCENRSVYSSDLLCKQCLSHNL